MLGLFVSLTPGHPPGVVRDTTGIAELPATGLPLGLFSHSTSDASTVALEPGAVLMLVSRGIVEAKCGGDEWGLDSVKNGLERSTAVGSKEFGLSVLDQIQQFMCTAPTHTETT